VHLSHSQRENDAHIMDRERDTHTMERKRDAHTMGKERDAHIMERERCKQNGQIEREREMTLEPLCDHLTQ
jgi:hypothetical protein